MELKRVRKVALAVGQPLWSSLRDLLPIILVVAFFQVINKLFTAVNLELAVVYNVDNTAALIALLLGL